MRINYFEKITNNFGIIIAPRSFVLASRFKINTHQILEHFEKKLIFLFVSTENECAGEKKTQKLTVLFECQYGNEDRISYIHIRFELEQKMSILCICICVHSEHNMSISLNQ